MPLEGTLVVLKKNILAHANGSITRGIRTALLRSLTKLLGEPVSDKAGMYWGPTSHKERLKEVDLKIARADRRRRALVRERTQAEKNLSEIDVLVESALGKDDSLSALHCELTEELDEIDLAIAQLDRDRKRLRKERRRVEDMKVFLV